MARWGGGATTIRCLPNVTMLTGHVIIRLCTSRNKKGSVCNKPSLNRKLCLCTITAIMVGHVEPERSSCFYVEVNLEKYKLF